MSQEAFQVANRSNLQRNLLEQLRSASPLTYYDSDWRAGTVKLANGQELRADIRYNLVARLLEIRRPGLPTASDSVLTLMQFQTLQLGTALPSIRREFVIHPYRSAQSGRDVNLFEKVTAAPGPLQLLLLHEVVTQTATQIVTPGATGRAAEEGIERVSRLYARAPKRDGLQEIPLTKSAILHLFGPDANRMAEYAAMQGLSFTNLSHAIQLVDEYNKTRQP